MTKHREIVLNFDGLDAAVAHLDRARSQGCQHDAVTIIAEGVARLTSCPRCGAKEGD